MLNEMFTFHHVGLACENIEQEIEVHKMLDFKVESAPFIDENQKIKGIFLTNNGFRIELLEATDEYSPILNYLKKGIRMYHQCYTTPNLQEAIDFLVHEQRAMVVVEPIEAVAFDGRKIAFVYLRSKMLIELIEE